MNREVWLTFPNPLLFIMCTLSRSNHGYLSSALPRYTNRAVTWACFRLEVMQTFQLMSPEIISHIMKKSSLAKVQPPYRTAIAPLRHKLFLNLQQNRRGEIPQTCSIIKILHSWHATSIFSSFISIMIIELRLKIFYT